MAKRLTDKQKELILRSFTEGKNIDALSKEFNCNKLTITRNLKKSLGEIKYKDLNKKNKLKNQNKSAGKDFTNLLNEDANKQIIDEEINFREHIYQGIQNEDNFDFHTFTEITPLDQNIEDNARKDLSSIPISEIDLPKIVYMIVSDKIDLETKLLEEYPKWQFLSEGELSRKTIEIYFDLKNAKRFCKSNQKVIKVPNSEVFKIVAPILRSRGVSRIVCEEDLLAL